MAQAAARQALGETSRMLDVVSQMLEFNKLMGGFATLAVAWFGSGLLCEDRRAGAHLLYFSRPITRLDYFLGKFLTVSFFSACSMLVPMLVICIVAAIASPEWSFLTERWDVIFRAVAYSLLWSTVMGVLVLLASSLAPRRNFALIGTFGFLILSVPIAEVLGQLVDRRFHALGLVEDLNALSYAIFGVQQRTSAAPGHAWVALGLFLALALGVISWRLKRLEVVE
jgi:hypothetical protein